VERVREEAEGPKPEDAEVVVGYGRRLGWKNFILYSLIRVETGREESSLP